MFTDEGFKYLLEVADSETKFQNMGYGYDLSKIVDLNPPNNIAEMQSVATVDLKDRLYHTIYSETVDVLNFQGGITYKHNLTFNNSGYNNTPGKHWERGIFGPTNKLLYYDLLINKNRTLLYSETPNNSYHPSTISINVPIKVLYKEVSIVLQDIPTSFKVKYEAIAPLTTTNIHISTRKVRRLLLLNTSNSTKVVGNPVLDSYDLETRTALFHLTVLIDESVKSSDNYLYFESLLGVFKITLLDPITDEPVDWPVTSGESLVIPLEFKLGDP